MNLFEIDNAIMNCIDEETGEVIDIEKLDDLQMQREEKIENICLWIKNLKAEAEALKEEKDNFAKRQKAAENKVESLKKYIESYLNGEKYKSTKVTVSYRKSESVEVVDIDSIPTEFLKFKEPDVDKMAVKQELKKGVDIPGVALVEKNSIQIK